jgi:hypothetical protein
MIKKCTSGVKLVQIRAFKTDPANAHASTGIMDRISARFTWLTAPLEGALAARYATNLYPVEPESEKNVTMTWDLTGAELKQLEDDLYTGPANQVSLAHLKQFWVSEATSLQKYQRNEPKFRRRVAPLGDELAARASASGHAPSRKAPATVG